MYTFTRASATLLFLAGLGACGSIDHDSPLDPQSPVERQKKGALSGAVRLESESDFGQVEVQLQNADRTYSVSTDPQGAFRVTGVVPGRYELRLTTRYFTAATEAVDVALGDDKDIGTRILAARRAAVKGAARVLEVAGGAQSTAGGVTVTLRKTASLRGAGKAPGLRAAAETSTNLYTVSTVSGADGAFTAPEVPAGHYEILASAPGIPPAVVGGADVSGEAPEVTVDDILLEPLTGFFEIEGTAASGLSNLYTRTNPVSLKLSGWSAQQMALGRSATGLAHDCAFEAPVPYAATASYTLPAQGPNTLCVRYLAADGRQTAPLTGSITYDATPPGFAMLQINNGAAFTSNVLTTLQLAGLDATSSVVGMQVSANAAFSGAVVEAPTPQKVWSLNGADGTKTVYARFLDGAGNYSSGVAASIVLDRTDPVLSGVTLNGGATLTNNTLVALAIAASDANPITGMQISEDPAFAGAAWVNYLASSVFSLSLLQGAHTVYVRVRDVAGHVSGAQSAAVALDTLPPVNTSVVLNGGAAYANVVTGTVTLAAADASAVQVRLTGDLAAVGGLPANVGAWLPMPAGATVSVTYTSAEGLKSVSAEFRDAAGNVAVGTYTDTLTLDRTAPAVPVINAATGDHHQITATWQPVAGAAFYDVDYAYLDGAGSALSSDGASPVRVPASQSTATLHGLPNLRNYQVRVRAVDAAGNASAYTTWLVTAAGGAVHAVADGGAAAGIAASQGKLVYAVGNGTFINLYRSEDGGTTWSQTASIDTGGLVNKLTVKANDEGLVYVVAWSGSQYNWDLELLRSSDAGASWKSVGPLGNYNNQYWVGRPDIDFRGADQVLVCAELFGSGYLLYSSNGGSSFVSTSYGSQYGWPCQVRLFKNHFLLLYAREYVGGLGTTFTLSAKRGDIPTGAFGALTTELTINPDINPGDAYLAEAADGTLYATSAAWSTYYLYKSTDQGVSWTLDETLPRKYLNSTASVGGALAFDPAGTLYVTNGDELRVRDGVGSWHTVKIPLNYNQIIQAMPAFVGAAPYVAIHDATVDDSLVWGPSLAPPYVTITNIDPNFGFLWLPSAGAESYTLYSGNAAYSQSTVVDLSTQTGGTATAAYTTQWFAAKAWNAEGASEFSNAVSRTTWTAFTPYAVNNIAGGYLYQDGRNIAVTILDSNPLSFTLNGGVTWTKGASAIGGLSNAATMTRAVNGTVYYCHNPYPTQNIAVYRYTNLGRAPESVTTFTAGTYSFSYRCGVAADGLGRVAVVAYATNVQKVVLFQSTDHGNTWTTTEIASLPTFNFVHAAYDPYGSLWVLVTQVNASTTNWWFLANGVAGRGTGVTSGTIANAPIDNGIKSLVDGHGYLHFIAGSQYLRSQTPTDMGTPVRGDFLGSYAVGTMWEGLDDDLYVMFGSYAAGFLARSVNHGESWTVDSNPQGYWAIYSYNRQLLQTYGSYKRTRPVPPRSDRYQEAPGKAGLLGYYYNGTDFDKPVDSRMDGPVDMTWAGAPISGAPTDGFSVRWLGNVFIDYNETYTFSVSSYDGVRLWVDGAPVIDAWQRRTAFTPAYTGTAALTRGWHRIRLDHANYTGTDAVRLQYSSASQALATIPASKLTRSEGDGRTDVRSGPTYFVTKENATFDTGANPGSGGVAVKTVGGTYDNAYGTVALPFAHRVFGVDKTTAYMSTNGYLSFDTGQTTTAVGTFPNTTVSNVYAAYAADLVTGSTAQAGMYYKVLGTAPWRRAVFTWYAWGWSGFPADNNTFQAILYETSGEVEYRYQSLTNHGTPQTGVNQGNGLEGVTIAPTVTAGSKQVRFSQNPDRFYPRY